METKSKTKLQGRGRRSKPPGERVTQRSASLTPQIDEIIQRESAHRRWSIAKTLGYFVEIGLDKANCACEASK